MYSSTLVRLGFRLAMAVGIQPDDQMSSDKTIDLSNSTLVKPLLNNMFPAQCLWSGGNCCKVWSAIPSSAVDHWQGGFILPSLWTLHHWQGKSTGLQDLRPLVEIFSKKEAYVFTSICIRNWCCAQPTVGMWLGMPAGFLAYDNTDWIHWLNSVRVTQFCMETLDRQKRLSMYHTYHRPPTLHCRKACDA